MEKISILGKSTRKASDLNRWLATKKCPQYGELYVSAGEEFNVRGDMALFQSCLETGWFWNNEGPFDVKKEQNNFAGCGATGGGVPGDSFPDAKTGIRAQCQDLALRCDTYLPKESIISPYAKKQYETISNRHSKLWEDLSGTWAADKTYHTQIYRIATQFDTWLAANSKPDSEAETITKIMLNRKDDGTPVATAYAGDVARWTKVFAGGSFDSFCEWCQQFVNISIIGVEDTTKAFPKLPDYGVEEPLPPEEKKKTRFFLDPGHSDSRQGARSNDGSVREEKLNQHAAKLCQTLLVEAGYEADYYDPDPDNLTGVGTKARVYDVAISFHNNSYSGGNNPYHCIMVDPKMPAGDKQKVSRLCQAIERGANGTCGDTVIFGGTNGIPGVYEAELSVINASQSDPDGKPPFHILPEFFFLNPMKDEQKCKDALNKIIPAFAAQLMLEFPN